MSKNRLLHKLHNKKRNLTQTPASVATGSGYLPHGLGKHTSRWSLDFDACRVRRQGAGSNQNSVQKCTKSGRKSDTSGLLRQGKNRRLVKFKSGCKPRKIRVIPTFKTTAAAWRFRYVSALSYCPPRPWLCCVQPVHRYYRLSGCRHGLISNTGAQQGRPVSADHN